MRVRDIGCVGEFAICNKAGRAGGWPEGCIWHVKCAKIARCSRPHPFRRARSLELRPLFFHRWLTCRCGGSGQSLVKLGFVRSRTPPQKNPMCLPFLRPVRAAVFLVHTSVCPVVEEDTRGHQSVGGCGRPASCAAQLQFSFRRTASYQWTCRESRVHMRPEGN